MDYTHQDLLNGILHIGIGFLSTMEKTGPKKLRKERVNRGCLLIGGPFNRGFTVICNLLSNKISMCTTCDPFHIQTVSLTL